MTEYAIIVGLVAAGLTAGVMTLKSALTRGYDSMTGAMTVIGEEISYEGTGERPLQVTPSGGIRPGSTSTLRHIGPHTPDANNPDICADCGEFL